jgi:hypothetical protein
VADRRFLDFAFHRLLLGALQDVQPRIDDPSRASRHADPSISS